MDVHVEHSNHTQKLLGVQLARGVAAFMVVLYHSGRLISLEQYVGYIPLGGFFNFGHAGVDFFFVLSGFVIHYAHHGDIGCPRSLPRYLWRRVTRIYPIYWLVTALVVILLVFKPSGLQQLDAGHLIRSLLLIPEDEAPVLGVAWTLTHEMSFYLVFALVILDRRLGIAVIAAWLLTIAAVQASAPGAWPLLFVGSASHLQFLMGAIVAHSLLRLEVPAPRSLAALGVVTFAVCGLLEDAHVMTQAGALSTLVFGLSAMGIILGTAAAERRGLLRFGRLSAFIGGASYSLYLIHTIVIGLTARTLMDVGLIKALPAAVVFVIVAVAAVASGAALYQLVERPLLRRLQEFGRTHIDGREA